MSDRPAVLVTGGAGYIGSHACKALHRRGYLPVALDSLANGRAEFVKWGPLAVGDIADRPLVRRLLGRHDARAVIHFAALAEVGQSMREPALYYENNLVKSLALIETVREAGVGRLVFSSSCAVYGAPERLPIGEEAVPRPISPYGESKLAVEWLLRGYDRAHGLRSVSLRYFNAAGADPEGEIGEWPVGRTRLVTRAIEAALGRLPEIVIHGADYPTRDGTAVRDYVHVADIADAHVDALAYLEAGGATALANLGSGRGHSVLEIIAAVERIAGRPIRRRLDQRRPGDPPELVADIARVRELLGWSPSHPDLDAIIGSAWSWQRGLTVDGASG